jgi:trigger factor
MQTKIEDLPKSKIKIHFELNSKEFLPYFEIAAREISKTIDVPGFRRGKAPRNIIEEKVGKDRLYEEAAMAALNKLFTQTVTEKKIKILGMPQADLNLPLLKDKGDFAANIEVAVFPEITLPDWKKIAKEEKLNKVTVSEKEVEDSLLWLRKSRAKYSRKLEPAVKGDAATLDYEIRSGGIQVENGQVKDEKIVLGENKLLPDFEKNIMGMSEGEEKSFSVVAPSDFWKEDLRGKSLDFKTKLKELFRVEIPELNDEFAKSLGKYEKVEDVTKNIKDGIKMEKEEKEKRRWQNAVFAEISKQAKIEVPEVLIEEQRDKMLEDLKRVVEQQMGLEFKKYLEQTKKTEEEIKKDFWKEAEMKVRAFLCIYEIAGKEEIKVTEKEVEEEAQKNLQAYPDLINQIKNDKQSEENFKNFIREKILEKKVINQLDKARE